MNSAETQQRCHALVSRSQTAFTVKAVWLRETSHVPPYRTLAKRTYPSLCRSLQPTSKQFQPTPRASLVVRRLSQRQLHRAFVQTFFPYMYVYGYDRSHSIISRKLSDDRTLSRALQCKFYQIAEFPSQNLLYVVCKCIILSLYIKRGV